MRVLSIENIKPGMIIGRTIMGATRQNLLTTGTVLTEEFIKRLETLGVSSVYIQDEHTEIVSIDDVVCEQTRLDAGNFVKDVMENMKLGRGFDPSECKRIINCIIDDLLSNRELLIKLIDIRSMGDYSYFHSVNVAILSGIVGISLGYSHLKLQELMVGALFHDIGKIMLYDQLSCKQSQVDEEPDPDIKKHPLLGFEILQRNKNLSILSAHVAFQHHERVDGNGYPRKLTGPDIHEYAKIVAIANTYDILTSDCPGRTRVPAYEAIEYLIINADLAFDLDMVNKFIECVALYPEGTFVKLNTGETAIIVQSYKEFPTRPRIKILTDAEGRKNTTLTIIELKNNLTYFVAKVLNDNEIPD